MHSLRYALAVGAAMLLAGPSADAQLRRTSTTVPEGASLPSGTCRIWIDGVPANRQPAPTDCDTARRTQPRNSRIIYGNSRSSSRVYGNRDPRAIPGTPQYDPRYDPRSSQYDPRLDPHNRANDRYDRRRDGDDDKWERKRAKERSKWERKQEKERNKAWKKGQKGRDHDGDDDDDDEHEGRRDRDGRYGTRGQDGRGCVDANRDGICDNAQSSSLPIPLPIPRTDPQGPNRRVCVDANRDGRCDDGGPLVRTRP